MMRFFAITTVILIFSHQVYADCYSETAEEMSYYAYMSEEELKTEYCRCRPMFDLYQEQFDSMIQKGQIGLAEGLLENQKLMSSEMTKISRVLKKDYGVDTEVKCP